MKKFLAGLLAICLVPLGVNAEATTVNSEKELRDALDNANVTEITLGADIETQGKININRDVTVDGQKHSITYVGKFFATKDGEGVDDNTVWSQKSSDGTEGAVYVLQVYESNVTIKDITLAGGNRGLGVNGGNVTLQGTINFENNGFQDIELSIGKGVTTKPTLKFDTLAKVNSDRQDLIVVQDTDADVIVYEEAKTFAKDEEVTLADMQEALTTKYDLTQPIEKDTTIYMKLVQLEDTTTTAPQEVENAKTGDMNLIMVLSLLGLAGAAVAVTGKKIFLNNNI